MWVMNQGGIGCIECIAFGACDNEIIVGTCNRDGVIVGRYESEERAKEVVRDFMLSIQQGKQTFWMPKE